MSSETISSVKNLKHEAESVLYSKQEVLNIALVLRKYVVIA